MNLYIIPLFILLPALTAAQSTDPTAAENHVVSSKSESSQEISTERIKLRGSALPLHTGFHFDSVYVNDQSVIDLTQAHICPQTLVSIRGRCLKNEKNGSQMVSKILEIRCTGECACAEPFDLSRYFANQTFDMYKLIADYLPPAHLAADSVSLLNGVSAEEYYWNCREFRLVYQ